MFQESREDDSKDNVWQTLIEMFGEANKPKIQEALQIIKVSRRKPTVNNAVEIVLELMEKEESKAASAKMSFASLAAVPQDYQITGSRDEPITETLPDNFSKVVELAKWEFKILILLRGLPGSGKSYLAKKIVEECGCGLDIRNHVLSADDFFYDHNGVYRYDVNRLSEAHEFTQNRCIKRLREGWSPIIIDNTNLKQWEMFPYVKIAMKYHYLIEILEPCTSWMKNAHILAKRNQHGVPKEKICRMMGNYETTSVQQLLKILDSESYICLEPSLRHLPAPVGAQHKPQREIFKNKLTQVSVASAEKKNEQEISWKTLEEDKFWDNYDKAGPSTSKDERVYSNEPKPPRDNLLKSLRDESATNAIAETSKKLETDKSLMKHKKGCENENLAFRELRQMFPTINIVYLWDLFEKCGGDADWATDLLFQDDSALTYSTSDSEDLQCDCDKEDPEPVTTKAKQNANLKKPPNSHKKTQQKQPHSAAKRLIEEQFAFGDDHYSETSRKIRDLRHPKPQVPLEADLQPENVDFDLNPELSEAEELIEVDLGSTLVMQLEQEYGTNNLSHSSTGETLSLGDIKLKTNVFMTKSLATQLYALWCESLYNQLEEQRQISMREDLEIARQLDAQEKYPGLFMNKEPKDLKDIIDLEMSLSAYKEDISKWRQEVPNTMATRLARDKLRAVFPNLNGDILDELLAAHKNDINETISVLKLSTETTTKDDIEKRSRELFAQTQDQIEQLSKDSLDFERKIESGAVNPEEIKRSALKDFQDCRNIAQHHSQLKAECYGKARNALQRNEHQVAVYYSQIANLHKSKIEFYNHKAANCLMEAHNCSQRSETMLDLHYLYLNEALQCLDLFLDKHICSLETSGTPFRHVFVITGRGKNSLGGRPAIKISSQKRLAERNLKFSEVNPGLLKIKVLRSSKYSKSF